MVKPISPLGCELEQRDYGSNESVPAPGVISGPVALGQINQNFKTRFALSKKESFKC